MGFDGSKIKRNIKTTPVISQSENKHPVDEFVVNNQKTKKQFPKWCVYASLITVALVIIVQAKYPEKQEDPVSSLVTFIKNNPDFFALKEIKLEATWEKSGFGSVLMLDINLKNGSEHTVKDIEITCISIANSGTILGENKKILYEIIPPGDSVQINKVNMGFIDNQTSNESCSVSNAIVNK